MQNKNISSVLKSVSKPGRYIGGEFNSVVKNRDEVGVRFAFCFPDTYEVGMSHLGMKILYHVLNQREDTYCERVFAPWIDMEEEMKKEGIPLCSAPGRAHMRQQLYLRHRPQNIHHRAEKRKTEKGIRQLEPFQSSRPEADGVPYSQRVRGHMRSVPLAGPRHTELLPVPLQELVRRSPAGFL